VRAEPVTVRIGVAEDPRLQHLVRREADARNDVGRRECRLLDLGSIRCRRIGMRRILNACFGFV
jgi:hypothetical protein